MLVTHKMTPRKDFPGPTVRECNLFPFLLQMHRLVRSPSRFVKPALPSDVTIVKLLDLDCSVLCVGSRQSDTVLPPSGTICMWMLDKKTLTLSDLLSEDSACCVYCMSTHDKIRKKLLLLCRENSAQSLRIYDLTTTPPRLESSLVVSQDLIHVIPTVSGRIHVERSAIYSVDGTGQSLIFPHAEFETTSDTACMDSVEDSVEFAEDIFSPHVMQTGSSLIIHDSKQRVWSLNMDTSEVRKLPSRFSEYWVETVFFGNHLPGANTISLLGMDDLSIGKDWSLSYPDYSAAATGVFYSFDTVCQNFRDIASLSCWSFLAVSRKSNLIYVLEVQCPNRSFASFLFGRPDQCGRRVTLFVAI